MRSINSNGAAGNIKMRGKKFKRFSCGCCNAFNFKDKYSELVARQEIKEYQNETKTEDGLAP